MLWEATAGLGHKRYVKLAVDLGNAYHRVSQMLRFPFGCPRCARWPGRPWHLLRIGIQGTFANGDAQTDGRNLSGFRASECVHRRAERICRILRRGRLELFQSVLNCVQPHVGFRLNIGPKVSFLFKFGSDAGMLDGEVFGEVVDFAG